MADNLKVLFLSSEVVPFAKTGGLADVAGTLPIALKHQGVDVRVIMPFYRSINEKAVKSTVIIEDIDVPFGDMMLKARILSTLLGEDIPVYLIEREDMFDRPGLYGNSKGDYYDNLERFSFFSHAALKTALALDFMPDIIHCHDWQTGLVPALLKGPYKTSGGLSRTATVFTIHNMGYQGIFPSDKLAITGLPGPQYFHPEGLEYWGNISLLKAGIVYSDAITTVSPTYAKEILTHEYGLGMEGVLMTRGNAIYGILNGVDYNVWDPGNDNYNAAIYSRKAPAAKKRCKEALIRDIGLSRNLSERPLIGVISRLDKQKGIDILLSALEEIIALDTGLIILGAGNEEIGKAFRKKAHQHPDRIAIGTGFNNPLAHQIMAGADIFIVPSRYEPCGLTQMYALRYGTVPVVRATGGLNDTIEQYDEKTNSGNGFKFEAYDANALLEAVKKAVELYSDKKAWKRLITSGMKYDFSWDRSARSYMEVYESIRRP